MFDNESGMDTLTFLLIGGLIIVALLFGGNGKPQDVNGSYNTSGSYNTYYENHNTSVCVFTWNCNN